MVPIIELYLHHTTFFVSGKFFVTHNEILQPIRNINTYAHLLSTKALRYELQEFIGKVIFLLILFSSIQLLYVTGMNGLDGFTLSGFETTRPCCCRFATLFSLITLHKLGCYERFTFSVSILPSFFTLMKYSPLSML